MHDNLTVFVDLNGTLVHQTKTCERITLDVCRTLAPYHPWLNPQRLGAAWARVSARDDQKHREGLDLLLKGREDVARPWLAEPARSESIVAVLRELGMAPHSSLVQHVDAAFEQSWMRGLNLPAQNLRTLKRLKHVGCRLGMITNFQNPRLVRSILVQFHLSGLFDDLVISADTGRRKPHPEIFRRALHHMRLQRPGQAVYVGDNPEEDIAGAEFAGLLPILIDPATPAPATVNHVTHIPCFAALPATLAMPTLFSSLISAAKTVPAQENNQLELVMQSN